MFWRGYCYIQCLLNHCLPVWNETKHQQHYFCFVNIQPELIAVHPQQNVINICLSAWLDRTKYNRCCTLWEHLIISILVKVTLLNRNYIQQKLVWSTVWTKQGPRPQLPWGAPYTGGLGAATVPSTITDWLWSHRMQTTRGLCPKLPTIKVTYSIMAFKWGCHFWSWEWLLQVCWWCSALTRWQTLFYPVAD